MTKMLVNGLFSTISDAELAAMAMNAEFNSDHIDDYSVADPAMNHSSKTETLTHTDSYRNNTTDEANADSSDK
ncbi:hypothetical protein HA075_00375 [bacterium BFN5]|nr:hypothetical protein HA075_00240 [bacterium BFN5]QJW44426.1 hypothetical protein HA075_00375 [bacterium BFN5]